MIVIVFFKDIIKDSLQSMLGSYQSNVERHDNVQHIRDDGEHLWLDKPQTTESRNKEDISHYQVI